LFDVVITYFKIRIINYYYYYCHHCYHHYYYSSRNT